MNVGLHDPSKKRFFWEKLLPQNNLEKKIKNHLFWPIFISEKKVWSNSHSVNLPFITLTDVNLKKFFTGLDFNLNKNIIKK